MAVSVKLSEEMVEEAKRYGGVYHRSPPKQIEYWFKIGKIAEQNPDLTFAFIQDILLAQEQNKNNETLPYIMGA